MNILIYKYKFSSTGRNAEIVRLEAMIEVQTPTIHFVCIHR
jgi:hypothetical protein